MAEGGDDTVSVEKATIGPHTLYRGSCEDVLPTLPAASFDCVICDPPYPCIKREYGWWSELQWHEMMDDVVPECRRVLTPTGSAVFILQPNSERVGRMRPWLWEFMAHWTREWGMVQDAWWWNNAAMPLAKNDPNRLRSSVKACVWLGSHDCHRDASGVMWKESDRNAAARASGRWVGVRRGNASRANVDDKRMTGAAAESGLVTPFNLLIAANTDSRSSAGANGHGAGTAEDVCGWWLRYICPPGGTCLDPFAGSGTTLLAAHKLGRQGVGIEKESKYFDIACKRLEAAIAETPLFGEATEACP